MAFSSGDKVVQMAILFLVVALAWKCVQNPMALKVRAMSGTAEMLCECADVLGALELDHFGNVRYITSHSGGLS